MQIRLNGAISECHVANALSPNIMILPNQPHKMLVIQYRQWHVNVLLDIIIHSRQIAANSSVVRF